MKKAFLFIAVMALYFCMQAAAGLSNTPGTIIFSKEPIDPKNPQNLVTDFKTGDYIYGCAFLEKSFRKLANNNNLRSGELLVYYQLPYWQSSGGTIRGSVLDQDYFLFEFAPNPILSDSYGNPEIEFKKYPNPDACGGPIRIAHHLSEQEPGEYEIEVKLNFQYQDVAFGKIKLSGENFDFYAEVRDGLIKGADAGAAADARMPQAKMQNSALESQMLSAFKNSNDWKTGRIKAKETLRIVIIDADWTIRRHELTGNILHRYIRAAIAVKDAEGKCGYYPIVTFQQDYAAGSYQPLKYDGASALVPMQCENVNK